MATAYVPWQGTAVIEGVEVYVVQIVEKRTMDGDEALVGTIRVRANGQEQEVMFESGGGSGRGPTTVWNGYEIYVGGRSRYGVDVAIRKAPH